MKRVVATSALVLLAATGCGGGSSKTASPGSSSSPTTAVPSDLPSAAASIIAGLSGTECADIASQFSKASSVFSTVDKTTPYSDRFQALSDAFSSAADKIENNDKAKAALKKIAEIYGNVAEGMKGVNYTPGTGQVPPAAYLNAIKSFGEPGFREAAQTMSAYFGGGCK